MLLGDGGEDFDDLGIELRAGAAADFFAGVRERKGFAIGAVADHGVERVGDSENTGPEGDLIALEAAGIAGAVVELLVSEDDFGGIAEERDADEHVVADFAVFAHDLLFVVCKGTGFAENAIGDGHLADVVGGKAARARMGEVVSFGTGMALAMEMQNAVTRWQ